MKSTYARDIVQLLEKTNYNEVMVIRSKLSDEDIEVINFLLINIKRMSCLLQCMKLYLMKMIIR